jgi:hypothetical protein
VAILGRRFLGALVSHQGGSNPDAKLFQYDGPLAEVDPEIDSIIKNEKARQVALFSAFVYFCPRAK